MTSSIGQVDNSISIYDETWYNFTISSYLGINNFTYSSKKQLTLGGYNNFYKPNNVTVLDC